MTEPDALIIYRCGWCGFPVDAGGAFLPDVFDPDDANQYLRNHEKARVEKVDGECCREQVHGAGYIEPGDEEW